MGTYGGPAGKGWNIHDGVVYRTGQGGGTDDVLIPYTSGGVLSVPIVPKLTNNYFASAVNWYSGITGATVTGNTFAGQTTIGITSAQYPSNVFTNGVRPTTNPAPFVYPNAYEKGCNVAG